MSDALAQNRSCKEPFRFENSLARFSETVGKIFFSASMNPKLRSRAMVRAGDKKEQWDPGDKWKSGQVMQWIRQSTRKN